MCRRRRADAGTAAGDERMAALEPVAIHGLEHWPMPATVARQRTMKLAILETGRPPGDLAERFGDYPSMFARMLSGEGIDIESFNVAAGELPADPMTYDAHLITGSPAGVYDPLPWIEPLSDFIRAAKTRKMVG